MKHPPGTSASPRDMEAALRAMSADELRAFVRTLAGGLEPGPRAQLTALLLKHASRGHAGWRPEAPAKGLITEVEEFVRAARRVGYADPEDVDDYLRQGTKAFLAGDFAAARAILGTLLLPLSEAEIDLGQDELLDEVLAEDLQDCAARYAVAVYRTTPLEERAEAVFEALESMGGMAFSGTPLADMERVSTKPLPELEQFLPRWVARLEQEPDAEGPWESERERMLREAVARAEGTAGLQRVALASGKPQALKAWCSALARQGQWPDALRAYEEAARHAPDSWWRGDFLDGAALAAARLGRADVSQRLETAWLAAPSLSRLLRWLDAGSPEAAALKRRAKATLKKCPAAAASLAGLLHVISGNIAGAATLLAGSNGLGWSDARHPGHLLFAVFAWLLGGAPSGTLRGELALRLHHPPTALADLDFASDFASDSDADFDENFDEDFEDGAAPEMPSQSLPKPSVVHVLQRSRVMERLTAKDRSTMLAALRTAASTRTDAVVQGKHRRTYEHAATLAACCVELESLHDNADAGAAWVARLRERTRRYPAFQEALRGALGRVRAPHLKP